LGILSNKNPLVSILRVSLSRWRFDKDKIDEGFGGRKKKIAVKNKGRFCVENNL